MSGDRLLAWLVAGSIACATASVAAQPAKSPPPVAQPAPPVAQPAPPVVQPAPPVARSAPPVAQSAPPVAQSAPPVAQSAPPIAQSAPPIAQSAPPAPPAAAPARPAEATPDAKERARAAYTRGQASFAQGDYAAAKEAFQQAFDAVPNPIVLLSLAESATKLGRIDEAIVAFDRYLQLRPDAPDKAEVEQKRAALAFAPATLLIASEPPGASILIDGQPTNKLTPAELQVSPGQHELEVASDGFDKAVEPLQAAPGARIERRITLHRPAPPPITATPSPVEPTAVPAPKKPEVPTAALWVSGGLGAAGLIAGTVLGFLALKEHSDYEARPTESSADRGERLALFADVGFGVGAMALVTAAVLYLTYDDIPADTQAARTHAPLAATAPRFELEPRLSPNAASATARVRF